jgi:aconitate hydratase
VLAKSFARIHRQNLVNYGVLPLVFADAADYDRLGKGDLLLAEDLRRTLDSGGDVTFESKRSTIVTKHGLTRKQREAVLAGGLINWRRARATATDKVSVRDAGERTLS